MSAFSISAIDKLIQPCKKPESMEELYVGKPAFAFHPPLYVTPPIEPQRPSSPPSPSPYVVNFKRRGPVKRGHANEDADKQGHEPPQIDRSAVHDAAISEWSLQESDTEAMNMHLRERNPSLEFGYCENAETVGDATETEIDAHMRDHKQDASDRRVSQSGLDFAFAKMNAQSGNTRLELALSNGTRSATGLENNRFVSPRASAASEEFFDAPDAPLEDSSSEEEGSSSSLIMRMSGKSAEKLTSRLQEEIARRIKAEEATALLHRRWNEMARRCSLIGISLASGEDKSELGRQSVQELYDQFSEKVAVARLVGGAVASAAVRAAKDEELEIMVARKNMEISRLWDKLQYIELVNREMSQRNQEAIEIAQRRKRRHRKRQKWALTCLCSALCLGSAGLLCCKFLPWDEAETWTRSFKGLLKSEPISAEPCST